ASATIPSPSTDYSPKRVLGVEVYVDEMEKRVKVFGTPAGDASATLSRVPTARDIALMPYRFTVAVVLTAWELLRAIPLFFVGALLGAVAFAPIALILALVLLPIALMGLLAPEW